MSHNGVIIASIAFIASFALKSARKARKAKPLIAFIAPIAFIAFIGLIGLKRENQEIWSIFLLGDCVQKTRNKKCEKSQICEKNQSLLARLGY